MKKFKKLIPAMVMLLIATMLMGTTTYAWFSMNTTVTATGMKVQAKAEGGLLISSTAQANSWSSSASVTLSSSAVLLPASTADGTDWYHAHSQSSNLANDVLGYYKLTNGTSADTEPTGTTLGSSGTLYTSSASIGGTNEFVQITYDENGNNAVYDLGVDDGFYLLTKYYIRSSAEEIIINNTGSGDVDYKAIAINTVEVKTAAVSKELDKCLRIGVQLYDEDNAQKGDFVVLAPMNGADGLSATSGTQKKTTVELSDKAALIGLCSDSVTKYVANADLKFGATAADTIPSNTSGKYLTAYIYVWFEGEDGTCFSDNITATLDELQISVSFKVTNTTTEFDDIARTVS